MTTVLYHFTDQRSARKLGRYNAVLRPCRWPYVWLTIQPHPDFRKHGLRAMHGRPDRSQVRYLVTDVSGCKPWLGSAERDDLDPRIVWRLEERGDPWNWWISPGPVVANWDRSWAAAAGRVAGSQQPVPG